MDALTFDMKSRWSIFLLPDLLEWRRFYMDWVLKISLEKLGAPLKCEFLGLVHFLQAKIEVDTDIWWCRILFLFKAHLHAHSHGHTWPCDHATKVIFLVHNLKRVFVLIEILVYLFRSDLNLLRQGYKQCQAEYQKRCLWGGYIEARTYLCGCRHTCILFKWTERISIFFLSYLHVFTSFHVEIALDLGKPNHLMYGNLTGKSETA